MRRRDFIKGIVGSATAWPIALHAQQLAMPVIGWLNSGPGDNPYFASFLAVFRAALKDAGYLEGQNVEIDLHWANGRYAELPALAAELVRKKVAVIAAGGPPAALAAKAATVTIPIVFTTGDDPVRMGLVESFSRPGGNATGVNVVLDELETKRIGLLREVVPAATNYL
jgi:putative ABC transport system substrate-binding protein